MEFAKILHIKGRLICLNTPRIMGILNITPDSFYDGGKFVEEVKFLKQAEKMLMEGADILDIGGYSSRPRGENISMSVERKRIEPAIQSAIKHFPEAIISIDTFRSEIARIAVDNGAAIINDISGGELDRNMLKTVVKLSIPYIAMHMRGNPQTMHKFCAYENITEEIFDFFVRKKYMYHSLGGKDIMIDPGFGFSKNITQNYTLLKNLSILKKIEAPIVVGISRKSMVYRKLCSTPSATLNGTTILNTFALLNGASILRVHDVHEAKQIIQLIFDTVLVT